MRRILLATLATLPVLCATAAHAASDARSRPEPSLVELVDYVASNVRATYAGEQVYGSTDRRDLTGAVSGDRFGVQRVFASHDARLDRRVEWRGDAIRLHVGGATVLAAVHAAQGGGRFDIVLHGVPGRLCGVAPVERNGLGVERILDVESCAAGGGGALAFRFD